MRAEVLAALLAVMRGHPVAETPATPVTPVTLQPRYRSKAPELRALHALQVENGEAGNDDFPPVTAPATDLAEPDPGAIEERAALAADCVPARYLDGWARLNHQKPFAVSDAEWRLALDDGGQFLDAWGNEAAELGLTSGDLFDLPAGIVWRLAGERVEALCVDADGVDHVRLADGRTIKRRRGRGNDLTSSGATERHVAPDV